MRIHLKTYLKYSNYSFRHIVLLLIILLVTALFLFLGTWQMQRGHEKKSLLATKEIAEQSDYIALNMLIDSPIDSVRYRKVNTTGTFLNHQSFLLDNQIYQGKVGYHVLTPFEMQNKQLVLINRGWISAAPSRQILPALPAQEGAFTIEGYLEKGYVNPLIRNALETDNVTWPLRVQKVDFELFAELLGAPLAHVTVVLESPSESAFIPLPPIGAWLTPERHFGYAFQWYSLAGLLWLLIFISVWRSQKP